MTKKIYLFSDTDASKTEVGGKGFSLIRMANGGFPVPAGMVLSVNFFDTWLEELNAKEELRLLKRDSDDILRSKITALRKLAGRLEFSQLQRQQLHDNLQELAFTPEQLFSVRSSSPEEDMEGASFAGMYETYLGVKLDDLQARIRDVFVSCIDYRVVTYKRQKGFDFTKYAIAVVVMAQIKSDVAGVAFSINPLNNYYDEIVVNANFGLGESVVSGDTVPDEFVVDKIKNTIISEKIGEKKVSIVLGSNGGTHTLTPDARKTAALSHTQVIERSGMVKKIEAYYGMPMDTEWAYANQQFYMLQARPITTYIPLPPVFQTRPGRPKKLYLDLTLIEQGIQRPLSVMGTDCFRILCNEMGISAAGTPLAEKPGDFIYAAGGRAYVNLTTEILLEGKEGTAKEYEGLDSYAGQIIREVDMTPYQGKFTLDGAWKAAKAIFTGLYKSSDTIAGIIKGNKHPEELRKEIDRKGVLFLREIDKLNKADISFTEFAHQSMRKAADFMVHTSIPSLVDSEAAKNGLKKLFAKELKDEELLTAADQIDRGLPYNVTMDMNCRIYELMTLLDSKELESVETIIRKIKERTLSDAFMSKWDEFIRLYGFRGPREVDIKTPRYQDDPAIVIRQMQDYRGVPEVNSPAAILQQQVDVREKAYEMLQRQIEDKRKFEKLYTVLVNLGGYREIHKYYLVYAGEKIRYRALEIARQLLSQKRIDAVDDIFYLTIGEVQQALDRSGVDIRRMIVNHKKYMSFAETVDHFPPVIDSRGKILRPGRKKMAEDELAGDPVSAGRVEGKVVIVNYVGEKKVEKGDILVAKAADPGWTPLFINAAGILLEIGGMLQHGSLIAREYGKPCIAGIENLTQRLKDNDRIIMDGATGIVKLSKRK